jgi:hypothetical protein
MFRERAEVSGEYRGGAQGEHWLSYSIFLPANFRLNPCQNLFLGQVKPLDGVTGWDIDMGQISSPGLLYMSVRDGYYGLDVIGISGTSERFQQTEKRYRFSPLSAMRGRWTDDMTWTLRMTPFRLLSTEIWSLCIEAG